MSNFEVKLKNLIMGYMNKNMKNLDVAVQNILLATLKQFLELYGDTMCVQKKDIESKIYHINNFFNTCKREVITKIREER